MGSGNEMCAVAVCVYASERSSNSECMGEDGQTCPWLQLRCMSSMMLLDKISEVRKVTSCASHEWSWSFDRRLQHGLTFAGASSRDTNRRPRSCWLVARSSK